MGEGCLGDGTGLATHNPYIRKDYVIVIFVTQWVIRYGVVVTEILLEFALVPTSTTNVRTR